MSYGENLRGFQLDLPLGALYVAGVLLKAGHQVEIFDARIDFQDTRLLNTYQNRDYVEKHWEDEMKKVVDEKKPKLVGITNQFTAQVFDVIKLAKLIKKVDKKILLVVGGPHASTSPESLLELTDAIDIAVLGEGEYTMLEIVDYCEGKKSLTEIQGIAYRNQSGLVINTRREANQNLDDLPYPAYHLVRMEKYFRAVELGFPVRGRYNYPGSERSIPMITSRGCPFNCTFCSIHLHMGRRWRTHSVIYILNHIRFVVEQYSVKHIHFEDDSINIDIKRFEELIDGIIALNLGITWDTPNGMRAEGLTESLLRKIKKSKCTYLIIGVESGNQQVLDRIINKKLNLRKVLELAKLCKDIGIDLRAFYVFGFPGEKIRNIKQTMDFALGLMKKYGVYPYIHIAMPYLGTELYKVCRKEKYLIKPLTPDNYSSLISGTMLIKTNDFSIVDLERMHSGFHRRLRNLTLRNFLKLVQVVPKLIQEVTERSDKKVDNIEDIIQEIVEYQNCCRRTELLKQPEPNY
jgi:radical SAM superfamily enzyme YgiQ (UPF0313 family)